METIKNESWQADLSEILTEKREPISSGRGSSCVYLQVTGTVGIKLYGTELERDAAYLTQEYAATLDLAPKLGNYIDLPYSIIEEKDLCRPGWWPDEFKPKTLFGFVTEHLTQGDNELDWGMRAEYEKAFELPMVRDVCFDNIGTREDGKTVILDFDGRFFGILLKEDIIKINMEWCGITDKSKYLSKHATYWRPENLEGS